jgi:hypothetical protein
MGFAAELLVAMWREITMYQILGVLLAGIFSYSASIVTYRLYFHPLRKIPGPWLAAVTSWYEFYQDVILGGHYVKEYPVLHARYGQYSAPLLYLIGGEMER